MLILQYVAETKIKTIAKSARKKYRLIPLFILHFFLKPKTGKMRGGKPFSFVSHLFRFFSIKKQNILKIINNYKINLLYFFICFNKKVNLRILNTYFFCSFFTNVRY
jgi:hypothetical protein